MANIFKVIVYENGHNLASAKFIIKNYLLYFS